MPLKNSIAFIQLMGQSFNRYAKKMDKNMEFILGGNIGKRSKGDASKTSEIPPSSVRSKDGNVVFYIVNQPEQQHRAR